MGPRQAGSMPCKAMSVEVSLGLLRGRRGQLLELAWGTLDRTCREGQLGWCVSSRGKTSVIQTETPMSSRRSALHEQTGKSPDLGADLGVTWG